MAIILGRVSEVFFQTKLENKEEKKKKKSEKQNEICFDKNSNLRKISRWTRKSYLVCENRRTEKINK